MRSTGLARFTAFISGLALTLVLGSARPASAYSVLAHEATIDVTWDATLRPLLLRRYPRSTEDDLIRARSYAYGGAVIQDLGYYPFGNKFFSNLLHYVRSGDFVETLLRDAQTVDELAFALGALAHYTNDTTGHPEAVNLSVPIVYPKLQQKFGNSITYVEAPRQHVVVEFSFDIVNVATGRYLPDSYRQFIGFRVATPLLERAFRETYGLPMNALFADQDRAISTYRYAVSQIIPALTQAAWRDKREEIAQLTPTVEQASFVFAYRRGDFEREFGNDYQKPALFARFLGVMYRIVPKVGPLKPLKFKAPTPQAQQLFIKSFKDATDRYRVAVRDMSDRRFDFANLDFDTGRPSRHGEYALADETYAELLEKLMDKDAGTPPALLTRNIASFYGANPAPSGLSKDEQKHWGKVAAAFRALTAPAAAGVKTTPLRD